MDFPGVGTADESLLNQSALTGLTDSRNQLHYSYETCSNVDLYTYERKLSVRMAALRRRGTLRLSSTLHGDTLSPRPNLLNRHSSFALTLAVDRF